MAAMCTAVILPFLVFFSLNSAYPQNSRDLNDRFYEEIRQLIAERSADLKQTGLLRNDISSHPPKPQEVVGWPKKPLTLGQVSGVAVNSKNQPVLFHRGNHVWGVETFDQFHRYQPKDDGPIKEDTIVTLDPETGEIINSWGSNTFYLPHGITIDQHDNYWLTDVALHQAFKFQPGNPYPLLEFGQPFVPGIGIRHLCKPTSIAVASTGEIFIADGYCNHRVLKFNAAGGLLRIIPKPPAFLSLQVPHGLALMEEEDKICIADRENMRVTCPSAGLRTTVEEQPLNIQQPDFGRVFDIALQGHYIYAVNGPTSPMIPVRGFTIDPSSESIIDHWSPKEGFKNPHTIAVSPNGTALYIGEIGPNRIWKFDLVTRHERD